MSPSFLNELERQVTSARQQLLEAQHRGDADAAQVARDRLADLVDLARRNDCRA